MQPAGKRDRQITLRRYRIEQNDFGESVEVWRDLVIVWAEKSEIRDSERFAAQEVNASLTARFQILYSNQVEDLTPRDRLVYGGREHDIVAIKEIGYRETLEITAARRTD